MKDRQTRAKLMVLVAKSSDHFVNTRTKGPMLNGRSIVSPLAYTSLKNTTNTPLILLRTCVGVHDVKLHLEKKLLCDPD